MRYAFLGNTARDCSRGELTSVLAHSCDPLFLFQSLRSFLGNIHVIHIKKMAYKIKNNIQYYLDEYCKGESIVSLAKSANYPPYLFARLMVESLTTISKSDISKAVSNASSYLTDLSVIHQAYQHSEQQQVLPSPQVGETASPSPFPTRLARELHQAVSLDPVSGPRHDAARRRVGIEYEVVLERKLSLIGKYKKNLMFRVCSYFA